MDEINQEVKKPFLGSLLNDKVYLVIGVLLIVLSLGLKFFTSLQDSQFEVKGGILFVFLIAVPLLSMYFFTKKIPNHSWGKIFLMVGISFFVSNIVNSIPIISLISFVLWVFIFMKLFKVTFLKALIIGICQVIINIILMVNIAFFVLSF